MSQLPIPGSMKMNLKMPEVQYIPGSCNIGKGEVRRRQLVALVGLFFTAVTLLTFSTVDTPTEIRLGIFFPLMVASVGFVQSRSKFCLAYGFAGTFNVGKMGDIKRVASKEDRAADRKTALVILSFLMDFSDLQCKNFNCSIKSS